MISLAGKAAVEVRYGIPGVGGMMDYRSAYFGLRELFVHEAVYGFDLIGGTVSKKDSEINMYHQHMVISHRIAEYYHSAAWIWSFPRWMDRAKQSFRRSTAR